MRRLTSILALAALALALAACGEKSEPEISSTPAEAPFEITGDWEGEVTQQGSKPFKVQATIASLERFKGNTVRYGDLDCSGSWEYLGASATTYRFKEVIDRGKSAKCKGAGTVSLTPQSDDRLDYEYRAGSVVRGGVLNRVSPAKSG